MKASSWNSPNDNGNGDMRWIISTRSTLKIASTFQCNRRRRLLDSSFLLLLLGSAVVLLLPTSAAGTVAQSSVTSSDPLKDGFLSGQSSSTIDEEDGTIDFDLVYVPATSRRARTTTNEEDDDALIYTSRSSTSETDDDSDVASSDETHQRSSNDDKENKDRDTDTDTDANENKNKDDSIIFEHFVAHNDSMTCSSDEHARPFNNQIRGVNLGGWMVLEPWITPSLFYQFLGKNGANETAFDMYTFCTVLGAPEANRQLRRHWSTWVTEEIIQQLADSGAVNSVRLPVGDFQFVPYGPYEQCVDGGLAFVDQLLDWCYSRGISVLLDVHTARDSQNGFDNSGQALGLQWTSALSSEFAGLTTFEHWPIRTANWVGEFDGTTATYRSINYENIDHSLKVIRRMVHMYAHHPAILGIEPLNEPWQYTPIDVLQRFYWDGYLIVKRRAPYWKYIMHDSFRFDTNIWGGFMDGCPERALDTHMYQAWRDPDSRVGFYTDACRQKASIASMENAFGPVIVGEWSLATDNCGTLSACALVGAPIVAFAKESNSKLTCFRFGSL
jgi:Cellulase (glycosyl hydrolase family 5)